MTEREIEQRLIDKLTDLNYAHCEDINNRLALEQNFREKFEELNHVALTDKEFGRLLEQIITSDVYKASQILRETNYFEREDGSPLHYTLVNTKNWCKNTFEVANQVRINTDYSHHRYDVVLLINGIPIAQVELKSAQFTPRRAMQQIANYKNDPGNGYGKTLMCFIQFFIASNLELTWYFANNNNQHFKFDVDERFLPFYQFANRNNEPITHLEDFAEAFLAKCTLGQTISRYMVLIASEQKLMMMRPYQVYAVKTIMDCIQQNSGNGYIWHTTGSGKTLTSFKASTLMKDNPDIAKCLFVVDRKDLDRQTREEFNRFQENCVEENTNTETLVERMLSEDYDDKVIVTTIQKLGLALDENSRRNQGRQKRGKEAYTQRLETLKDKRMVFIFDECHRSQFGDNHKAIKEFFPRAQLFGFTGTPIFEENATYQQATGQEGSYKTTKDIFQHCLHEYTITHAIEDKNVLPFHVDYYKPEGDNQSKPGEALAKQAIIQSILKKHKDATNERKFNALLATASIDDAIEYYDLFKNTQKETPEPEHLNIACVFSPPAEGKKDIQQIQEDLPQEKEDNAINPGKKKKALQAIISDHNKKYGTHHSIDEFDKYYQDTQRRIKNQQYPIPRSDKIDITIVVDMLLTGFDSKYLNTLYVDKKLKHHGLIQAFSRTNRILNNTKPHGNILDFRQQQEAVDNAIVLFSGEEKNKKAKEIWLVDPAPDVMKKLEMAINNLGEFMRSQGLSNKPKDVPKLRGEAANCQFVNLFREVQCLKIQLDQYTDLSAEQKQQINRIIPEEQLQGFRGVYLETAKNLKATQDAQAKYDVYTMPEAHDALPRSDYAPEEQELDFEFVLFASEMIDYDYIMKLIAQYSHSPPEKREMSRKQLIGLIATDAKFMDERDDIEAYINTLAEGKGLSEEQIHEGYEAFKRELQVQELEKIAKEHKLDAAALQSFVDTILKRMIFEDNELVELIAHLELNWEGRMDKKLVLMEDLIPILRKHSHGRDISGLSSYG